MLNIGLLKGSRTNTQHPGLKTAHYYVSDAPSDTVASATIYGCDALDSQPGVSL